MSQPPVYSTSASSSQTSFAEGKLEQLPSFPSFEKTPSPPAYSQQPQRYHFHISAPQPAKEGQRDHQQHRHSSPELSIWGRNVSAASASRREQQGQVTSIWGPSLRSSSFTSCGSSTNSSSSSSSGKRNQATNIWGNAAASTRNVTSNSPRSNEASEMHLVGIERREMPNPWGQGAVRRSLGKGWRFWD
ncbi:hypothetical protein T439DRAFT_329342 [Meredithblackwellia eburnea MCA 4105]